MKEVRKDSLAYTGVALLTDNRGVTISTSEGKAEILNEQVTSLFGSSDSLPISEIHWSFPKMR